jgi:transcriptional regulator
MYIPALNEITDKKEIVAFMQQYSFATIVTVKDNFQTATHLPFTISIENDELILTSHFARANKQWEEIEQQQVLVVFAEPHAYISPTHYEKELNVPTWNYMAVHVYCKGKIIADIAGSFEMLETMITTYEPAYKKQWDSLPIEFKNKMIKGIVPFQLKVNKIEAKKKISQNKTIAEQTRIAESLLQSNLSVEQEIGQLMKKNLM